MHPQCAGYPQHCGEGRITVFGQGLVKALPRHPRFAGQVCHVLRTRDVIEGGPNQAAVAGVLFRSGLQIQAGILSGLQVLGNVPANKCLCHGSPPFCGQLPSLLDVVLLAAFMACLPSLTSRPSPQVYRQYANGHDGEDRLATAALGTGKRPPCNTWGCSRLALPPHEV